MKTKKVSFNSQGQRVAGILHLPEEKNPPCVIASHGLLSSKESEKYVAMGETLSKKGIAMLRFDFRGCGESEGKWEDDTVSRRIADLRSAIDFVRSYSGLGNRVGLLGSSLGGYITLVMAAVEKGIRSVVIWSTPFHLDGLESKQGTEGVPPLGNAFFKDLPKHRLLPLLPAVSNGMVIHGEADELVPVDQAWEIFHGLGSPKEIHVIEGADHRLTHPNHRQRAMDLSCEWFRKFL
jgi:alpha-beta hydrolase superfamily lysophospholipase